ncbi:iron uptake porin [Microcoleus sp. FACHB-SPT15]|uniref:iron uptake porin n=1 Tax=Microcoleus sp. FACHB-SPT15 TaxID=2692830 RepID=UPI0017802C49|nr:iron uptake porin [Microcoleus sp. FACHB-SPT15]MBD1809008.1 iron uptake porin [Microcoleus sp. FACHB-SPT15]
MSTMFWNALKLSPALLGASLLFVSSTQAQGSVPSQAAAINNSQVVVTVEPIAEALTQLPQSTVALSNSDQVTTTTSQTATTEETTSPLTATETSSSLNPTNNLLAQQVPASDTSEVLEQINQYNNPGGESLDQVTNVTQLSDVSPGDWAYEALRSLVERYGCIAGYPDGTFRGNRATTRYEFAAGLNACLQQVERLIAASVEGFVTREDLETLQRLVQEFEVELATLGTRVDDLEGRVAFLEDHQFSTTTKLNGEVIFAISDLFGGDEVDVDTDGDGDDDASVGLDFDDNTVFQDRVRLNFDTSFTGKDRLRTRLQARNVATFEALTSNGLTREGRLGFEGNEGNDIQLDILGYRFPVGPAVVQIYANGAGLDDLATTVNPLDSSGSGSISRFGQRNPIYRVGDQNAGAGITFAPSSLLRVDLGYLSGEAEDPSEGAGVFNGNYSAIAQVTFQPAEFFRIAATYIHSYDNDNLRHGTGSLASQVDVNRPLVANSYGVEASFAFSPQLVLSGWAGYTDVIVLETGNADVWNYGATLAINDLGTEGSTLGFVVGMEPKLTGASSTVGSILGTRRDDDTGLHVEGFYKLKVSDNIAITPGVIWLTAPGHDEENEDIFVGTIRTTFTF